MAAKAPTTLEAQTEQSAVTTATGGPGVALADDTSMLPQSGWLTAEWVKRYYSISNSTLYKWIDEKRFPAPVKIGPRAVRWSAASLRAYEAALQAGE